MIKNLAIIPARMGSKRLPKKNIKKFNGKPLLVHTLDCAIKSKLFDEIHVSTESDEIIDLCKINKFFIKFKRPKKLAEDDITLQEVCEFVINKYKTLKFEFDNICILWPTSPFRLPIDIIKSYELLKGSDAVVSTCEYNLPFFSSFEVLNENFLKPFFPDKLFGNINRPKAVSINSSLCWVKTEEFIKQKTWLPKKLKSYKMPSNRSTDINTIDDWNRAKYLLNKKTLLEKYEEN